MAQENEDALTAAAKALADASDALAAASDALASASATPNPAAMESADMGAAMKEEREPDDFPPMES